MNASLSVRQKARLDSSRNGLCGHVRDANQDALLSCGPDALPGVAVGFPRVRRSQGSPGLRAYVDHMPREAQETVNGAAIGTSGSVRSHFVSPLSGHRSTGVQLEHAPHSGWSRNPTHRNSPRVGAAGSYSAWVRTPLLRNFFYLFLTSVLGYGLTFLFWLLAARAFPVESIGIGATLVATALILGGLATVGLPQGLIRFLPQESRKPAVITGALALTATASFLIGLAFVVGLPIWAPGLLILWNDPALFGLHLACVIGFGLAPVLDSTFAAARRTDYGLVRSTAYGALRLPFLFVITAVSGSFAILFATGTAVVASIALSLVLLPRVFPGFRPGAALNGLRGTGILRYSLWSHGAATLSGFALSLLPLLILNLEEGGAASTAYFFAAAQLATLLYVIPASFATSLLIEGSHSAADYARRFREATLVGVGLLALGIIAAIALGQSLLGFFGDSYARSAYDTFVLLSFASPFVLAHSLVATNLRVSKRVRALFLFTLASTSVSIAVAYLLIPAYGISGAAIGFAVGQGLGLPALIFERRSRPASTSPSTGAQPHIEGSSAGDHSADLSQIDRRRNTEAQPWVQEEPHRHLDRR